MRSRIVQPDTTRIELSDGDWLVVKKRLSHGDRTAAQQRMYRDINGEMQIDRTLVAMSMVLAYLVDWSFIDHQGHKIAIQGQSPEDVMSALNAIAPEDFDEVSDAIDAHSTAMRAERDAQKKILNGESPHSPTLPSLVGAT